MFEPSIILDPDLRSLGLTRRRLLTNSGIVATTGLTAAWLRGGNEGTWRTDVFVAKAESYTIDLVTVIRRGLIELGLSRRWTKGKSVLLKPNLVEPSRTAPHINTHPVLIRAVAEVFRSWGAKDVFIAEGPGHCRDAELVLEQSGLGEILDDSKLDFIDLNHDDVMTVRNRMNASSLDRLYLPATLRRADLVVSLPKMKTHHWETATLSMKNLFGLLPGAVYGWPKNVLHFAGIAESILDINASVKTHLAIVDGIVGMEGDGPIMGTPKDAGVLVMGTNLPAVDATAARLMGIDPRRVPHLAAASGRLGPIEEAHIRQRGETVSSLIAPFATISSPKQVAPHVSRLCSQRTRNR